MKYIFTIALCFSITFGCAQIDTLQQKMLPMSATIEKPYKVGSVYYKKGTKTPYTGVLYGKFDNGKYLTLQEYKGGIGNGTYINYYENGNPKEVGTYIDNRVEGPVKLYHSNGKIKASGTFKHWKRRTGLWTFYDENGKQVKTISY
ncbi:hypothetical protein EZY14_009450 [Kordia sp. TARA_039_SRF]|nr:hypothetical protein EZY14_009450 [Kordia sp. TARA_039_SRF]